MKSPSDNPRIAFFGTPKIAGQILEKLINSNFKPQLVVTGADIGQGRGKKLQTTPVKEIAQKNHIKTIEPDNLLNVNFLKEFKAFSPDIVILAAYGKIVPNKVLSIPKFGFVNIHPSLLPKYRGPSPIISAILDGTKETGVTIMKLDEELDHGPILAQKKTEIANDDNHDTLAAKLALVGSDLLLATLPGYLQGSTSPKPQHHLNATWTEKIEKQNGHIDLLNPPDPQTLNRMIRAYFPWPTVWSEINGKRIKFLPENKIQPEGKRPMTIKEFLNGYPEFKDKIENLFKQ